MSASASEESEGTLTETSGGDTSASVAIRPLEALLGRLVENDQLPSAQVWARPTPRSQSRSHRVSLPLVDASRPRIPLPSLSLRADCQSRNLRYSQPSRSVTWISVLVELPWTTVPTATPPVTTFAQAVPAQL